MAAKPITARVDLYSVRFCMNKGKRFLELVVLEQTNDKPPTSRTRKEDYWREYGTVTLGIIPRTGDLKGEHFTLTAPASFTESHEYGKGKEQQGRRKFVIVTDHQPTSAELERLYCGQENGWDLAIQPVAKTKELDLEQHPDAGAAPSTETVAVNDPEAPKPKRKRKAKE